MKTYIVFFLCLISAVLGVSLNNQACVTVLENMERIQENGQQFMNMLREKVGDEGIKSLLKNVQDARDEYAVKYDCKFDIPVKEPMFAVIVAVILDGIDLPSKVGSDTVKMFQLLKMVASEWKQLRTSFDSCPVEKTSDDKKMLEMFFGFVTQYASIIRNGIDFEKILKDAHQSKTE